MESMKTKALAPWFGGKRNLAETIVEELGKHRCYWSPFCGAMSIILSKPRCPAETVNDLHGDLINRAKVIQNTKTGPMLYRRLRRVFMCEESYNESRDTIAASEAPDEIDPDRAYHYFITAWMGRSGMAGTKNKNKRFSTRYTSNGGTLPARWESAINSIPSFRRRLQNVTILRRDAFEVLEKIDDATGTVIYCDPPYFDKGKEYEYDLDDSQHDRLAELLNRFQKARVVLSYYQHPKLAELYPAWIQRQIIIRKQLAAIAKRDTTNNIQAVEVLLINGKSFAEQNQQTPEPQMLFV